LALPFFGVFYPVEFAAKSDNFMESNMAAQKISENPMYTDENVLVVSLKNAPGGLYHPLVRKAREWIVDMVPLLDNENGADFWCWIERHYFNTLSDPQYDTFFLFDAETQEILGTGSCVPDDRDVGKDYGITGVWGGGVNIRDGARGKGAAQVLRRVFEKHLVNVAKTTNLALWFNLFTQDSAMADVLRHSGYEIPQNVTLNGAKIRNLRVRGKLYIQHFDSSEWWVRKRFTPSMSSRIEAGARALQKSAKSPIHFIIAFDDLEGDLRYGYTKRMKLRPSALITGIRRLHEIDPRNRNRAVVEIATRLGNIAFGDKEVWIGNRVGRHAYFKSLCAANPLTIKLVEAPQHMSVRIHSGKAKASRIYHLGCFQGYSTVIPCTFTAYKRFLDNQFQPLRLGPSDVLGERTDKSALILSADDCLGSTEFIFIEGYAHIPSLKESSTLNPDAKRSLIAHIGTFIQEGLALSADEDAVEYRNPSEKKRLPVIFCYANGKRQEELLVGLGFRESPLNSTQSWAEMSAQIQRSRPYELPKYIFDFLEFNRLKPLDKLKEKMRIAIKLFIRYRYPEGRAARIEKAKRS
jgi:hypothetical protein